MFANLSTIYLASYVLVIFALVLIFKKYTGKSSMTWLGILIVGIFAGIGPLIAIAYLLAALRNRNGKLEDSRPKVIYKPDGNYTVYSDSEDTTSTTSKKVTRLVGGILAGIAITAGLFVVGIIILVITFSSQSSGSKNM